MSTKSRVATALATLPLLPGLSHQAGTYAYGPAGAPHTGECLSKEPCVLFIAFEGPVDVQTKPASN
jgi:uncharacterized RmlC-like cupin family protein